MSVSADPEPLWSRVSDVLAREIAGLAAGCALPSEQRLCAQFSVSRVTVRRALLALREQGMVESRVGRGWFRAEVRDRQGTGAFVFEPLRSVIGFSEMAKLRQFDADSVVLAQRFRAATGREAALLGIAQESEVLLLRRLRRLDGVPVAIDESVVPRDVLPDAMSVDFSHASLHESFRRANAMPRTVVTEMRALAADRESARLLAVPRNFPLLQVRQLFHDQSGRAIEHGEISYRGDRYRFRSAVDVDPAGQTYSRNDHQI